MKYKGIELKKVTEPQIFDPPKKMLVWDSYESITELDVYAIVSRKDFPVICENSTWRHCAEIPKVAESKPVTYRELARWLAEGNGEVKDDLNDEGAIYTSQFYWKGQENDSVEDSIYVRKWDHNAWYKPTREYLGLED